MLESGLITLQLGLAFRNLVHCTSVGLQNNFISSEMIAMMYSVLATFTFDHPTGGQRATKNASAVAYAVEYASLQLKTISIEASEDTHSSYSSVLSFTSFCKNISPRS